MKYHNILLLGLANSGATVEHGLCLALQLIQHLPSSASAIPSFATIPPVLCPAYIVVGWPLPHPCCHGPLVLPSRQGHHLTATHEKAMAL
jgi:hypothetical protein